MSTTTSAAGDADVGVGPGGLFVLIVHCFDDATSAGSKANKMFTELVLSLVGKSARVTRRRMDDLADYTLDFEYEILTENSKHPVRKFDKLDMVFVGGDLKELPWSPVAYQLMTLLRMCTFCKKAVFSAGGAAFHAMFSLATQGRHYHVLNAPHGDLLDKLPAFGRFASGTPRHRVGWLDNETGDMYEYEEELKVWRPACNVGFYRHPIAGVPAADRGLRPPEKVLGRNLRVTREQQDVQAVEGKEDVLQIRNAAFHHFALRKMPVPKFVLSLPQNWYFNPDGALPATSGPAGSPVAILAEGRRGPAVFSYDGSVILGCELEGSGLGAAHSHKYIRRIMKNFTKETVALLKADSPAINQSLYAALFGVDGGRDALAPRPPPMAPPLACTTIASALGSGPKRTVVPVVNTAPVAASAALPPVATHDDVDNYALVSPRPHSTLGKKIRLSARTPDAARLKRLSAFLHDQRQGELDAIARAAFLAQEQAGRERGLHKVRGADEDRLPKADQIGADAPNESRRLFGSALDHLDGPRKVGFKETEAALLLGEAGGLKWRPNFEVKRPLTAPLDRSAMRPMVPQPAYNSTSGRVEPPPLQPQQNQLQQPIPSEAAAAAAAAAAAQAPVDQPPASFTEAAAANDLYDVYVKVVPKLGSRGLPFVNSVGTRDQYSSLAGAMKSGAFLPLKHPVPPRERPVEAPPPSPPKAKGAKGKAAQQAEPVPVLVPAQPQPQPPLKVVVTSGPDSCKPYNLAKRFDKLASENLDPTINEAGEYVGLYTEVYRSALEREIHEYNEAKKSFVGPPFRTFSGVASAIPLRKEGLVRPQGSYPKAPPPGLGDVLAADWNMGFLQREAETKKKQIGGGWRK